MRGDPRLDPAVRIGDVGLRFAFARWDRPRCSATGLRLEPTPLDLERSSSSPRDPHGDDAARTRVHPASVLPSPGQAGAPGMARAGAPHRGDRLAAIRDLPRRRRHASCSRYRPLALPEIGVRSVSRVYGDLGSLQGSEASGPPGAPKLDRQSQGIPGAGRAGHVLLVSVTIWIWSVTGPVGLASVLAQSSGLELVEMSSLDWHATANVGIGSDGQSRFLVWDRGGNGPMTMWGPEGRFQLPISTKDVVGAGYSDEAVTVFRAGDSPEIRRYSRSGRILASKPVLGAPDLLEAVRLKDDWYLLTVDEEGRATVSKVAATDSLARPLILLPPPYPGEAPQYQLRVGIGGLIVTMSSRPFTALEIPLADDHPHRSIETALVDPAGLARGDFQGWQSLPLLSLDRGYVQVLADLHSDQRILVVFGPDGSQSRVQHLSVPFGLISSLPASKLLLGARDLGDTVQFVLYRWQWLTDQNPPQSKEIPHADVLDFPHLHPCLDFPLGPTRICARTLLRLQLAPS